MDPERAQEIAQWVANTYYGGNFARMAKALGIDKGSVSRWANAKGGITHRNLQRMSEVLGISTQEILNRQRPSTVRRGMFLQASMGRKSDLPPYYPPELLQAIDWHLEQGEDPRAVQISASKVWDRVAPGDELDWLDYADKMQQYLSRLRVRSPG